MRIGTIGAGAVALAVARQALARGHEIVLSSRSGPGALADKVTELQALSVISCSCPWSLGGSTLREGHKPMLVDSGGKRNKQGACTQYSLGISGINLAA